MKKDKRDIFLTLASEVNWDLCGFCKYWECAGSICDGGDGECTHKLIDRFGHISDNYFGLEPDQDCWGFRPKFDVSFCADILGAVLANGWDECVWWEDDGIWKIAGR